MKVEAPRAWPPVHRAVDATFSRGPARVRNRGVGHGAEEVACIDGSHKLASTGTFSMPWTQAGSAVVIVAQQFNPSIINQLWLVRNEVLADADFQDGSLYSDLVVQVRSRLFHMLVIQEQLQFVPVV